MDFLDRVVTFLFYSGLYARLANIVVGRAIMNYTLADGEPYASVLTPYASGDIDFSIYMMESMLAIVMYAITIYRRKIDAITLLAHSTWGLYTIYLYYTYWGEAMTVWHYIHLGTAPMVLLTGWPGFELA